MCLRQFCVIRIELFIPLRCAKVHFGRNPLQLKCRQLQGPACRCGNLILRVYYLGLKTGPGHRDHTSYLLRALRRYWRQPESQLQPHFPKSNGWFDLKLGRSHCMTGRGEVEEVKFVYVGVFFFGVWSERDPGEVKRRWWVKRYGRTDGEKFYCAGNESLWSYKSFGGPSPPSLVSATVPASPCSSSQQRRNIWL